MDLKDLRYFKTVAETGSFTKAAEKLFITQPTISIAMKNLEKEMGIQLIDKSHNQINLTPAGEIFLDKAREISKGIEELRNEIQNYKDNQTYEIKLGIPYTAGTRYWSQLFEQFQSEYPQINIKLLDYITSDMTRDLENNKLDIGIAVNQDVLINNENFTNHVILTEEIQLLCHPDHPLADKETIEMEDLKNITLYLHKKGLPASEYYLLNDLEAAQIPYELKLVNEQSTTFNLVGQNLGLSIILGEISNTHLKTLAFKNPRYYDLVIFWLKSKNLSRTEELFINYAMNFTDKN